MNFPKMKVAYDDTFWVRDQTLEAAPTVKPNQPLSSSEEDDE